MKTAIKRIGPGIEKGDDTLKSIGRDEREQADGCNRCQPDKAKMPDAHAGQEQHPKHRHAHDYGSTEIRLLQQQYADRRHHQPDYHYALSEVMQLFLFAYEITGHIDHEKEFDELGGLQIDDAHPEPTRAAVDRDSNTRNEHQHQQGQAQ